MLKQKMKLLSIAALALSASLSAQAHQIWIEQDAAGARLYLGEFADNLRETSPGMLDKFSLTSARLQTAQGERPVQLSKQATAFALSARAGAAESLLAQESGYPSWEQKKADKTERHIWTPAARWVPDFGARAPVTRTPPITRSALRTAFSILIGFE